MNETLPTPLAIGPGDGLLWPIGHVDLFVEHKSPLQSLRRCYWDKWRDELPAGGWLLIDLSPDEMDRATMWFDADGRRGMFKPIECFQSPGEFERMRDAHIVGACENYFFRVLPQ